MNSTKSRNKETPFKDFYDWYFKDWMVSGARARLSVPARSIYQDLLGFAYVEGGFAPDKATLMLRLGIPAEYSKEMDAAIAEFEVDKSGRMTHPRVLLEVKKLQTARALRSKGGNARAAKYSKPAPAPTPTLKPAEPEPADEDF
jgi:hypothetical protein